MNFLLLYFVLNLKYVLKKRSSIVFFQQLNTYLEQKRYPWSQVNSAVFQFEIFLTRNTISFSLCLVNVFLILISVRRSDSLSMTLLLSRLNSGNNVKNGKS